METAAQAPIAYTIDEAVKVSGIGRSRLYRCISEGRIGAKKFGARTLILADDLREFLSKLPAANTAGAQQ